MLTLFSFLFLSGVFGVGLVGWYIPLGNLWGFEIVHR